MWDKKLNSSFKFRYDISFLTIISFFFLDSVLQNLKVVALSPLRHMWPNKLTSEIKHFFQFAKTESKQKKKLIGIKPEKL